MHPLIQVEVVRYQAPQSGKHLVVLGGIHGNETCGTYAIEKIVNELKSGNIGLQRGQIIFIPCCNARARKVNTRFIEKNLNRVFKEHKSPQAYEEHLANKLISIIGTPDFILDLHSFHVGGENASAYAIRADSGDVVSRIVQQLPVDYCLNGWQEIQAAFGRPESFSTIDYAKSKHVPALGVECGQHDSPAARNVAYFSLRKVMAELGICDFQTNQKAVSVTNVFFKYLCIYEAGARFLKAWRDFDEVKKGEPIGRLASGQIVCAPVTGKMVFPHPNAMPGEEWFYITQGSHDSQRLEQPA